MITEKNHKLLTSQLFVTDCTKKGLASMCISIQEATIIYRNHPSHTSFYTRGYNHIQKSLLSHLILYKRLQSYTEITPLTPHSIQEAHHYMY
jgi:hypothetical protein